MNENRRNLKLSFFLKSRNFYDSRSYGDSGDGIFSLNRSCLDTSRYRIQRVQEYWGYRRYRGYRRYSR